MYYVLIIKEKLKHKLFAKRYSLYASRGFSLIELILVIAILSIMAVMFISLINPAEQMRKANDARRKSDLAQIQKTLEAYLNDNGQYPAHTTTTPLHRLYPGNVMYDWGTTWTAYKTALPADDPSSSRNYVYFSTGQSYWLYASLERGNKDPQVCASGGAGICLSISANSIPTTACGASVTCNYGVSSPNTSP